MPAVSGPLPTHPELDDGNIYIIISPYFSLQICREGSNTLSGASIAGYILALNVPCGLFSPIYYLSIFLPPKFAVRALIP